MRRIVLLLHTSLDGFAAGPSGEMDWIKVDDEMFDFVGQLTANADAALYGRITWQMMDQYWPNAANQPNPTRHDIEHSTWYNEVEKFVLSGTLQSSTAKKITVIGNDFADAIRKIKNKPGKDILLIGSPTVVRELMANNLIDDYWLFLNPVILGKGIPVFASGVDHIQLELATIKHFPNGVAAMNYKLVQ